MGLLVYQHCLATVALAFLAFLGRILPDVGVPQHMTRGLQVLAVHGWGIAACLLFGRCVLLTVVDNA